MQNVEISRENIVIPGYMKIVEKLTSYKYRDDNRNSEASDFLSAIFHNISKWNMCYAFNARRRQRYFCGAPRLFPLRRSDERPR